tara:strand:- start:883 stop:1086 length:204 start_codon:yes stop_codon:yes gene_type:complete
MYCGTINSYSRVERMNKPNEQKNEQQFTSMAHKRRVERLQKMVNPNNNWQEKPKEETEYGFFLAKRG